MQHSKFPSINVNLKPSRCECPGRCLAIPLRKQDHRADCPSAPVLIPCPIPRSVPFEVAPRPSEWCDGCPHCVMRSIPCARCAACRADAPSRPVKVAATIGGETWEESFVLDLEVFPRETTVMVSTYDMPRILAAARERWALVKALLTNPGLRITGWEGSTALFAQRDAMFAALCKMARAEQDAWEAQEGAVRSLGDCHFIPDNFIRAEPHSRPSAHILERYVQRLVEQVGVLP